MGSEVKNEGSEVEPGKKGWVERRCFNLCFSLFIYILTVNKLVILKLSLYYP